MGRVGFDLLADTVDPHVDRPIEGIGIAGIGEVEQALARERPLGMIGEGFEQLEFRACQRLLHALVVVESAYRPQACSHAGACGLTQLMPGTAADLGVRDRFDPYENLRGGADYLARQILRFGDLRLALAAYNSGPDRVARLGRIPNITETQNYVVTVINCYLALTAGRGVRSSRECTPAEAAL